MGSVYLVSYGALEQLSTFLPGKLIMPNVHQVTPQGGLSLGLRVLPDFLTRFVTSVNCRATISKVKS